MCAVIPATQWVWFMWTELISAPFSSAAGLPQPAPPGRHLGHYPSLPPGYQNTPTPHNATSPMHPALQAATQPYTRAPQPYQQVRGKSLPWCWLSTVRAFCIYCLLAGCGAMCSAISVMHLLVTYTHAKTFSLSKLYGNLKLSLRSNICRFVEAKLTKHKIFFRNLRDLNKCKWLFLGTIVTHWFADISGWLLFLRYITDGCQCHPWL